jgi:hypothetical protein
MSAPHDSRPLSGVCILHFAFCIALASCAAVPKPIALPSDPGTPFPDFAAVHTQLSSACSGIRTLTMEIGLSAKVGDQKLRGRVVAGFERPSSMHLQGLAPFGQPVFILSARGGSATLLLPREGRIIRNAAPEAILDALTGVSLGPADLQAVFAGCVIPSPRATVGRMHANGWASIDIESADPQTTPRRTASLFLRRVGSQWQLRAARRDGWQVEYVPGTGSFPQSVQLHSTTAAVHVDLTASLSQFETNKEIDPAAFALDGPKDAASMTVEELRQAGPLRGQ